MSSTEIRKLVTLLEGLRNKEVKEWGPNRRRQRPGRPSDRSPRGGPSDGGPSGDDSSDGGPSGDGPFVTKPWAPGGAADTQQIPGRGGSNKDGGHGFSIGRKKIKDDVALDEGLGSLYRALKAMYKKWKYEKMRKSGTLEPHLKKKHEEEFSSIDDLDIADPRHPQYKSPEAKAAAVTRANAETGRILKKLTGRKKGEYKPPRKKRSDSGKKRGGKKKPPARPGDRIDR